MRFGRRLLPLVAGVLCLASAIPAAAAGNFNLTTSPLPVDLITKPGRPVTTSLRVQNSGSEPMTLKVTLDKFKAGGSSGNPQISSCTAADDFCRWVSFSKSSFLAEPGRWYSVNMTLSPPKDAGFGYYYAVIFSNANPGKADSARSNVLTGATATMVLVDVQKPGEKRQIKLSNFSATHKLYEYLPTDFDVSVANTGNIHLIPSGSIYIKRGNKTVATLDINPNGGNVLPGSSRTFRVSWSDGFPAFRSYTKNGQIATDKQGRPVQRLDWNFNKAGQLRFGHYTAHLVLTYNDGSRDVPLQGDVSFWVVPWKLIIAVLAVISGLYLLHRWSIKRALARQKRRTAKLEAKKNED